MNGKLPVVPYHDGGVSIRIDVVDLAAAGKILHELRALVDEAEYSSNPHLLHDAVILAVAQYKRLRVLLQRPVITHQSPGGAK
jgi:hypothetical protein